MLTVIKHIGTPSWLQPPPSEDIPADEKKAVEIIKRIRWLSGCFFDDFYISKDEICEMVECLKSHGRKLFQAKKYAECAGFYIHALRLPNLLSTVASQLNSNAALCYLKLECPYYCLDFSSQAIALNPSNAKGHYCLATSKFLLYDFDIALGHIAIGLKINSESLELLSLREKVISKQATYKSSQIIVCKRIKLYERRIAAVGPWLEVDQLIKSDAEDDFVQFEFHAVRIVDNRFASSAFFKSIRFYHQAYNALVDAEHILYLSKVKYEQMFGPECFYFICKERASCLYYMEQYQSALELANRAKTFRESDFDQMLIEVKIYYKLNKPAEAIALVDKWLNFLKQNPVEWLMVEELLFLFCFQNTSSEKLFESFPKLHAYRISKSQKQNSNSNSETEHKSVKNEDVTKSDQKMNVNNNHCVAATISDLTNKHGGKDPNRWCDVCRVDISDSKNSWPEHLAGKKHKSLAKNVASDVEVSNGTRDYKNDFLENNPEFEMNLPSSSMDSSTVSSSTSSSSLLNGHFNQKPTEDKSLKKVQNAKAKETVAKNLPSNKNNRTLPRYFRSCTTCNVKVGISKSGWNDHIKGKKHQQCLMKEQEKMKKMSDHESETSDEESATHSSETEILEDETRNVHEEEEFFTVSEGVSIYGSVEENLGEGSKGVNDGVPKSEAVVPIRDKKLKVLDDPLFLDVKPKQKSENVKKKRNKRQKKPPSHYFEKPKQFQIPARGAVNNIDTVDTGDVHIIDTVDQVTTQHSISRHSDSIIDEVQQNDDWETINKNKKTTNGPLNQDNIFITLSESETFPLQKNSYNIIILCQACVKSPGRCKDCFENLLYVQNKRTGDWIAIRERNDQGFFLGRYRICGNSTPCFRGSVCCFAHSQEEEVVWNKEKDKKFSIRDFIKRHRKRTVPECDKIKLIYDKFPGFLTYNCGECYSSDKSLIGKADGDLYCSNKTAKHNWNKSKIIIHKNKWNDRMTPVYGYSGKRAFEVCRDGRFCSKKIGKCLKAHSQLESEIWMFFDENKCKEIEFVEKFNELNEHNNTNWRRAANPSDVNNPPHVIKKICSICWCRNVVSYELNGACSGPGRHRWAYGCDTFYIPRARLPLRHLPRVIPRGNEFSICWNVLWKKDCQTDCQFAHCQEELETWKWMADTGCKDPGIVVKKCESSTMVATVVNNSTVVKCSTVVNNSTVVKCSTVLESSLVFENSAAMERPKPKKAWSNLPQVEAFKIQKEEKHYCPFCEKIFSGKKDLEIHSNKLEHMENVKSDSCMQWNYRIPPYDPKFELCSSHVQGRCYFSNVPDENNFCTHAHSQAELDEWNERKRWKAVKWNNAERDHLLSMSSKLVKKYEEAATKMDVVVSHIDGIEIIANSDLTFRSTDKQCQHIWSFDITSTRPLRTAYLLKEQCRNNFSLLQDPSARDKQYIQAALLMRNTDPVKYKVFLKFRCKMFGSFSQAVVFDFGGYPVVCRNVKCEVGSRVHLEKLETIKLNMSLSRWTSKNKRIITYPESGSVVMSSIMTKYSSKDIDEVLNDNPLLIPLHRETYRRKMHGLLYLEELTQTEIISRYNLETTIILDNKFESSMGGVQMCQNGDLYGTITLSNLIIEGSLMLKSVRKVWFKPLKRSHHDYVCSDVYEASIPEFEEKTMKNMTGELVIILLSARCCADLGLKAGEELKAEVQFQLDRESYCRMHYALDNLKNMDVLFPKLDGIESPQIGSAIGLPELNERQNEVFRHALRQGNSLLPPLVVYGPFGTGKTETLAKTSLFLVRNKKESKILICTKSNMTADEYLKRYFCNTDNSKLKIIRIYNEERRIDTVDRSVHPFCLLDEGEKRFHLPTEADLSESRIVITTLEMSFCLRDMGKQCPFTHIFIDEAGQDLECRTIIPMMVANEMTCVVIAGDHRQMGEEVFSRDVQDQNFSCSLMERLLQHYKKLKNFKQIPQVFFNENYRNQKDILAFISQLYYGSKDSLISKHVERQSRLKPLGFFAVSGEEVVDKESASIYNLAEVEEVVEKVSFLFENWPEGWGTRDASQILVTSPYMDQIRHIRNALRNKSRKLASVTVIRVQNVPGLEFRAVFMSSVRTSGKVLQNQLESGCSDDGFLTQPKLLNSAFTRAKSYLAVVGDPFTLCSTGECSKIWIEFLVKCEEMKTILPEEITLEMIKSACSSKLSVIYSKIQEESEMNEAFDDRDWQGGFRLKSDDVIKQLVLEYSNKEAYGFKLTVQESVGDGRHETRPNALDFVHGVRDPMERQLMNDDQLHRCRLHVFGSNKFVARPYEPLGYEIIIPTRRGCRTALDQDDVVVSIVNRDGVGGPDGIVYGEVVGIMKRKVEVRDKKFVCFVDEHNVDLMIPINKKMPKIKIVTSERAKENRSHVSIYDVVNGRLNFKRDVPVNFCDPHANLYLVNLLQWETQYNFPLGVVLQTVKPGSNMENTMHILDLEHDVPQPLQASCPKRSMGIDIREDCTDLLVFTIDGIETEDIDDAIGFEVINQDSICLSIHIADVSFYIDANSPLDEKIKERATSFYPRNRRPVHMLPENFSTDLCSLKEGEEKLALSVFIPLDDEGNFDHDKVWIKRTRIKSKYRLTYEEVDSILNDDIISTRAYTPELIIALKKINEITAKWKHGRLGSDAMEWISDIFSMDGPISRSMIAELMIQANGIVARFLLQKLPKYTPLRVQITPDETELEKWRKEFQSVVFQTCGLRRFLKTFPNICRCKGFCSCVESAGRTDIDIPLSVYNEINNALEIHDPNSLRAIIHNLDKFPQTVTAMNLLMKLRDAAEYICSGNFGDEHKIHFSLNLKAYTHFTSPIRRYIDIVVHRLLIDCIENKQPTYSAEEVAEICRHCTFVSGVARDYDKAVHCALMCTFLQDQPLTVDATISKIDEKFQLDLHSMAWHSVFKSQFTVKPTYFSLSKQPERLVGTDSINFSWSKRIYENRMEDFRNPNVTYCSKKIISPKRHVVNVKPQDWLAYLNLAEDGNRLDDDVVKEMLGKVISRSENDFELTSELLMGINNTTPYCNYSLQVKPGNMIKVQLSSKLYRGLLTPFVQLIPITKLTSICMEHNSDPVKCFSEIPNKIASKNSYTSLNEYKHLWRSALSVESAHSSIVNGVPAIIHNIQIEWDFENMDSRFIGKFRLDKNFCTERGLSNIFLGKEDLLQEPGSINLSINSTFICVQYPGTVLETSNVDYKIRNVLGESHTVNLILHCLIVGTKPIPNTSLIEFYCSVKQQSFKFSNEIKEILSNNQKQAVIEWIEQPLPLRRMMDSIENLNSDLVLAEKIALNKNISAPGVEADVTITWPDSSLKPNFIQERAIKLAMNSSFSLIQGPPGTGKTYVVAHLVNQFYSLNKDTENQIMCCGPSNRSADVIASALLKLNPHLDILRVCSEEAENKCYPLPYRSGFIKEKIKLSDEKTDEILKDHTLHHLIRNVNKCRNAAAILNLEAELNLAPENLEKLKRYKDMKRRAEKQFLLNAKIIITTCTGSGASKFDECRIKQLLIDECGMCMEPESMVPIVNTKAQQIILIGDHKQLRPIITNKSAAKAGLETSLFQRYNKSAFMLTKQYRMHEAIAEFPSKQFYEGKLTIGRDSQRNPSELNIWPGGRGMPTVFVHVGGSEESLAASTEEGGTESKKNKVQVELAVTCAFRLIHTHKVKPDDVVILSQYRSQCTAILKRLQEKNLSSVSVSTVISSQGSERKYVILSTVRSLPKHAIEKNPGKTWKVKNLGFVVDPHQINVALTRAKEGLIILGNKDLLSTDRMWSDLVDHYQARGALVTKENFPLIY